VRRRNDGVEFRACELRVQARDVVNLDGDEAAGLEQLAAFLECRLRIANVIEDVLESDDVELAFAHGVIFERSDEDAVAIFLARGHAIVRCDFVAVALPALHGV
jgi:hypothetical protein